MSKKHVLLKIVLLTPSHFIKPLSEFNSLTAQSEFWLDKAGHLSHFSWLCKEKTAKSTFFALRANFEAKNLLQKCYDFERRTSTIVTV